MTREERIKVAAMDFIKHLTENTYQCHLEQHALKYGFIDGAMWADSHPNWNPYPYDKPEKAGWLLVALDKGDIDILWYDLEKKTFRLYDTTPGVPVAWMELPEPPKFD